MKQAKVLALALVLTAVGGPAFVQADAQQIVSPASGLQGYAGPGWSILFGADGAAEIASLGPVMFRVFDRIYLGPVIAYQESASEGPDSFLGGVKVEAYLSRPSWGFYSTSIALSALAGASGINQEPVFSAQLDAELDANLLLFPAFTLAVGPVLSLRLRSERLTVLPGVGFSVKESTLDGPKALVNWGPAGPKVGGYWQGLWTFANGSLVFVDGGGTRVEFPGGLAVGITGGVLRQRVQQSGSDLAIMLAGVSAEWNAHLTGWLTVTPRVVTGVALYGWVAADETVEGGPHFMIRPELCAYLGVLPFLELGGGIGYQFVLGASNTTIPLDPLSSAAFSVQVRVGHR